MTSLDTGPDWFRSLAEKSDRGAAAVDLGEAFMVADLKDREGIRAGWNFGVEWPYPAPERLACTVGEVYSPRARIVASLILDSLEGVSGTREHLIALCATFRACELAQLSAVDVFEAVAVILTPPDADALRSFVRRSPDERQPSAFGIKERTNADGETELHIQWMK
jgi:hypothetical protein